MKAERVILSFVAVLIGLLVAGGAFYVYQHYFHSHPQTTQIITVKPTMAPSPTPEIAGDYLTVSQPTDQSVFSAHSITVEGKATKNSTILVSTPSTDEVGVAGPDGTYSITITIDNDTNPLYITAMYPDGTQQEVTKTVTYSTESF